MMGKYVAVIWNLKTIRKKIIHENVEYIDFVNVRESNNDIWIDEDSSVAGGIDIRVSKILIEEIKKANEYIEGLEQ